MPMDRSGCFLTKMSVCLRNADSDEVTGGFQKKMRLPKYPRKRLMKQK